MLMLLTSHLRPSSRIPNRNIGRNVMLLQMSERKQTDFFLK